MNRRKPSQVLQSRLGLYSRAILLIGVVLLGISIVVTFWNIQTERERLTEELESRVVELATQQAVSVSNSLWDLNRDGVRVILQGLEQDPDFASVSVFDEKGRIFVEIESTDLTGSPNVTASRDIVLEEQGVQKTIGSLTLTLSRGQSSRSATRPQR